jgi:hypothetical protein
MQLVRDQLEPLLPLPAECAPDWDDVLRRAAPARHPRRRRRSFAIGAAVAAAAAAAAVAVADVGGFAPWLSGEPGSPVSPAEQQAFEQANARTWVGFAPGTQLRQLLTTSSSGATFTLFGFRSGDDLCLKLVVTGGVTGDATDCAPEHDLQTAKEPAVVVAADQPFGTAGGPGPDSYTADAYQATFGIASDGVQRVTVSGDDGSHDALVGGNAFLYVDDHPPRGTRVRDVDAVSASGNRVALPFESSPYGDFDMSAPPTGTFHGPSAPQRHVTGGTIGWLVNEQPRGDAVPGALTSRLAPMVEHPPPPGLGAGAWPPRPLHVVFARLIQPDPSDFVRFAVVGVSPTDSLTDPDAGVCIDQVQQQTISSGCNSLARTFEHGPLDASLEGSGMSQYSLVSGLASDDVARIAAYLGNGDVVPVPLLDNVFLTRVARADYPLRIVAYDSAGRVIAVQDFKDDGMTSAAPAAARNSVKTLATATSAGGETATLRAGTPAGGYRCWWIGLADGAGEGGCTPWPPHDGLRTVGVIGQGENRILGGEVAPGITSVRVTYPDGTTASLDTSGGLAFAAIPAAELARVPFDLRLDGLDSHGRVVVTEGLEVSG